MFLLPILIFSCLVYYFCFSASAQFFGKVIYKGESKEKLIALTFDDGPNEPDTSKLLTILKEHNVKATFFVVGENILKHASTLKQTYEDGHVIGNHSYNHSFLAPILTPDFKEQISKTQEIIEQQINKRPSLFRPPWFFRVPAMLHTAEVTGLTTITGIFGSRLEVFQLDAHNIATTAFRKAQPGSILVFHDGYDNKGGHRAKTVEAVALLIPQLLQAGYKFVTVPELLHIQPYQ